VTAKLKTRDYTPNVRGALDGVRVLDLSRLVAGNTLTGVLAALAAQGLSLYDSARLGAWLCGRAAECAITRGGESEESLSATHVVANLGAAFRDLRDGAF